MGWASLATAVAQAFASITRLLENRQLLMAGAAQSVAAGFGKLMEVISRVQKARASLRHDPDSVRADPRNRDRPNDPV